MRLIGVPNKHIYQYNERPCGVKNNKIVIIPTTINDKAPDEAEFRVQDVLGSAQAVYLESVHMPGYFLSFDEDGTPGDEIKLKTKDTVSQFEIQLVTTILDFIRFIYFVCLFI